MDENDDSEGSEWSASDSDLSETGDEYEDIEIDNSSEEEDGVINLDEHINLAPDGTQWSFDQQRGGQPPIRNIRNIRRHPPGPKTNEAREADDPIQAWKLFMSEDILEEILNCTLVKLAAYRVTHRQAWLTNVTIDLEDIYAYIGIRYHIGKDRNGKINTKTLWDSNDGDPLCIATMSRNKFLLIHHLLRFDDIHTRPERRVDDKFAAVRNIYTIFSRNCSEAWRPEHHATVDEQIVSFRGKCPVKVYDQSKPDKYGIKFFLIADSSTLLVLFIEPYASGPNLPEGYFSGVQIFKRLVTGASLPPGTGICADRFFVDFSLVDWCFRLNFTVLGTVRNDKRCVPMSMRKEHLRGNPERYSRTVYAQNCSLSGYIPPNHAHRKFKVVLCLSSEHINANIDRDTGKPLSILAYNKCKPGVDMFNWCSKEYTTRKPTRRWPMRGFENILDIAGYNGWVVLRHNRPNMFPSVRRGGRKLFLASLAKLLTRPSMERRANARVGLQQKQQNCLQLFGIEVRVPRDPAPQGFRAVCSYCPAARKRKSTQRCRRCDRVACGEHSQVTRLCLTCVDID